MVAVFSFGCWRANATDQRVRRFASSKNESFLFNTRKERKGKRKKENRKRKLPFYVVERSTTGEGRVAGPDVTGGERRRVRVAARRRTTSRTVLRGHQRVEPFQ